jgi:catechol 2,3-dioxygenase-like lactoylglutathione lyase family enzyme
VFDHVTIRASDLGASESFYEIVLSPLEIERTSTAEWDDFSLAQATEEQPVTKRLHIGFAAPSRAHVDEFWRAGTEAGYTDDGAPGPRPQYGHDYYGAFLFDPDGNSIEGVHHGATGGGGNIDHIWIRVANVAAARRFYEAVADQTGFRLNRSSTEHVQFVGPESSFSLRQGRTTENVHVAFPASDNVTVDAFHRVATEAGYRDNGAPGERPVYHEGYYAAFVLDPDGHNVEVVNHNR